MCENIMIALRTNIKLMVTIKLDGRERSIANNVAYVVLKLVINLSRLRCGVGWRMLHGNEVVEETT